MQLNLADVSNRAMTTTAPAASPAAETPEPSDAAAVAHSPQPAPTSPNRITLSYGGRLLAKSSDQGPDAATRAIKESKYPDEIKELMIKIRELQAELREKAKELQEVAGDQSLTPRQREMKTAALREAVSSITSAIRTAMSTLNETMTELDFSSEDRRAVGVMLSGA